MNSAIRCHGYFARVCAAQDRGQSGMMRLRGAGHRAVKTMVEQTLMPGLAAV
jgi:hypothetical protein